MDSKTQLEYELAKINLDKRQLQLDEAKLHLERKELDVKQRLAQLKTVKLTKDEVKVKAEYRNTSRASSQESIQDTSSVEPPANKSATILTTNSAAVNEEETINVEQQEKSTESHSKLNAAVNEPSTVARDSAPKPANQVQQIQPSNFALASNIPETATSGQDLLAMFLTRPKTGVPMPQTGFKRTHNFDDDEATASSRANNKDTETIKHEKDQSKAKRRRMSRADNKLAAESTGPMTEAEQYELISRYTELFLKHMQAAEREWEVKGNSKPVVVSKARRATQGLAHQSLTLLHREFELLLTEHSKSPVLRCTLQAELDKFENALPYWSPKCKALLRQRDRLAMVTRVVEEIADGEFDSKEYKESYDPYDEL